MVTKLLLGDEAIAQGALDAGMSGCYAYPGTPSTEINEYVQASALAKERKVHSLWSANEKTAMEEALGMSYAGKRSMVCMKHVGLNVAADGFVNSAITGVNGGMIVTVADDPSMHSSQNEQDSRFYAKFAMIPCLEPTNQQEAYDMINYAFEYSEKQEIPIMMRITTRLAHSRANVQVVETAKNENENSLPKDKKKFVLLPSIARRNYNALVSKQEQFIAASEQSPFNKLIIGKDKSLGIIASGIAYNYLMEAFQGKECPYSILKISQYPIPVKQLRQLQDSCEKLMVMEEGVPLIEEMLTGPLGNDKVVGRLSGALPRVGELNAKHVAIALGLSEKSEITNNEMVRNRPPRLCQGCPHIFSYKALLEAMDDVEQGHVFSDIGCYTLGALPPFNAVSTCVDMGASITVAKGAADAGMRPVVSVIGDSTFTHSGLTGLLDVVWENTPITIFLLDNYTTGMTGGQDSIGFGKFAKMVEGIGVDPKHIRMIDPLPKNHEQNVQLLREELEYQGVSVVIAQRECIQTLRRKKSK